MSSENVYDTLKALANLDNLSDEDREQFEKEQTEAGADEVVSYNLAVGAALTQADKSLVQSAMIANALRAVLRVAIMTEGFLLHPNVIVAGATQALALLLSEVVDKSQLGQPGGEKAVAASIAEHLEHLLKVNNSDGKFLALDGPGSAPGRAEAYACSLLVEIEETIELLKKAAKEGPPKTIN